jgi:hypothetical protein
MRINLLVSDLRFEDLAETLGFLQVALGLEIRRAPVDSLDVSLGSLFDFLVQVVKAVAQREQPGPKTEDARPYIAEDAACRKTR